MALQITLKNSRSIDREALSPLADLRNLRPKHRYTLLLESTFGKGSCLMYITADSVQVQQSSNSEKTFAELTFRPRGMRTINSLKLSSTQEFIIYENWISLEQIYFRNQHINSLLAKDPSALINLDFQVQDVAHRIQHSPFFQWLKASSHH